MTIPDLGPDHKVWKHGDLTATEVFRAHARGCSIPEQDGPHFEDLVKWVGTDCVLLETDFPHGDSGWPCTRSVLDQALKGFSPQESFALRIGNAMDWYDLASTDVAVPALETI